MKSFNVKYKYHVLFKCYWFVIECLPFANSLDLGTTDLHIHCQGNSRPIIQTDTERKEQGNDAACFSYCDLHSSQGQLELLFDFSTLCPIKLALYISSWILTCGFKFLYIQKISLLH